MEPITPTRLVEAIKHCVPGEQFVYHQGFIAIDRTQNDRIDQMFERLFVLINLLSDGNVIFPYNERQGEMEYFYGLRTLMIVPSVMASVALEVENKKEFNSGWFKTAKLSQINNSIHK